MLGGTLLREASAIEAMRSLEGVVFVSVSGAVSRRNIGVADMFMCPVLYFLRNLSVEV